MLKLREIREHFGQCVTDDPLLPGVAVECHFPKKWGDELCLGIYPTTEGHRFQLSYFIGLDWIQVNEYAVYVEPKVNEEGSSKTDFVGMLFSALKHPELLEYTDELFVIKFDAPYIDINQQDDILTPLVVVQFLRLVEAIVRKGLKKSYYRVKRDIVARIKGKVVVAETIRRNVVRSRHVNTVCSYEEFGVNGFENRMLKKALSFIQRYLPSIGDIKAGSLLADLLNYIMPAFEPVSDDISLEDVKQTPSNVFYSEYVEGIRLARVILKRFGYNIANTRAGTKVKTPPFWIDMSKLFELYVLGLLKERYGNQVEFQVQVNYGQVDFLLRAGPLKMVVDAKYKLLYNEAKYDIDDVRQLSAYGRDRRTLSKLGISPDDWGRTVVDCLIIYPQRVALDVGDGGNAFLPDLQLKTEITQFEGFFKLPVTLPVVLPKL